ncbi:MAG TPA: hypothetical protein VGR76_01830 [Candidatus Angelobacter sp.]|jgi:hypothetical protein|nr:hypothetical protein [Candidatus Angelobacter sp.]
MSESSTDERESWQEAPEQPEPPRVRNGVEKKAVLPADADLERLVHDSAPEILTAVAADARLTEDLALALLNRSDLPREALEAVSKNGQLARLRKVRMGIVVHPRTPRHVSVPTIRHLYTFDLMQVALLPSVPPDVKRAAEEVLISKLASISSGERVTLARRSSGRVAGALLLDKDERIMQAALANPQMTEVSIVKALKAGQSTELLAPAVARHQKWSYRNDVKAALLGNKDTPSGRLIHLAAELPINLIKDVLRSGRLTTQAKNSLLAVLEKRGVTTKI